jgi:hypothetical protein
MKWTQLRTSDSCNWLDSGHVLLDAVRILLSVLLNAVIFNISVLSICIVLCLFYGVVFPIVCLSWKQQWAFLIICRLCPSVSKLFTFSTSFSEPLCQFWLNLSKGLIKLELREYKFVQMKRNTFLHREIIAKNALTKSIHSCRTRRPI